MSTATPATVRLNLMHASMQFSDTPPQMAHDAQALFERAAKRSVAWVTGTEAGAGADPLAQLLRDQARAHGYRFWMHPAQDSWVAVRRDLIDGDWSTYYGGTVVDGKKGQFTNKGVLSASFRNDRLGVVTVVACHYLTKGRPSAKDPVYRQHVEENRALARAIGAHARERGRGTALVFYAGDQNIVDRTDDTFFGEPLTSCWDEIGEWPNTGHGNIDVIASYDHDGRVSCRSARALTDKQFPLFSDHFAIEAVYDVRALKEAR